MADHVPHFPREKHIRYLAQLQAHQAATYEPLKKRDPITSLLAPVEAVAQKAHHQKPASPPPRPLSPPLPYVDTDEGRARAFHRYVKRHLYEGDKAAEITKLHCRVLDVRANQVVWFVEWRDPRLEYQNVVKDSFLKRHFKYQLLLIDFFTTRTTYLPNRLSDILRGCNIVLRDVRPDDVNSLCPPPACTCQDDDGQMMQEILMESQDAIPDTDSNFLAQNDYNQIMEENLKKSPNAIPGTNGSFLAQNCGVMDEDDQEQFLAFPPEHWQPGGISPPHFQEDTVIPEFAAGHSLMHSTGYVPPSPEDTEVWMCSVIEALKN